MEKCPDDDEEGCEEVVLLEQLELLLPKLLPVDPVSLWRSA
jgi:hypothetical protein